MATRFEKAEAVKRSIHRVNAQGVILGRLAAQIAGLLVGKSKTGYSPHVDMGDFVEVENVEAFKVAADKWNSKIYHRYTGYPGGLHSRKLREVPPREAIRIAVAGMLPKNTFRARRLKRLRFVSKK